MASAVILLPFYIGYLSTSNYGALSIYLAFSLLVQILTTYSFDTSLYIHFHEYKTDKRKLASFVSSAFIFMCIIGAGVGIIFTIGGELVFNQIFSDRPISFYPYGWMAVMTGIFQALFKVHSNLLQSREQPQVYLWANVLSFASIAVFTILGLYFFPETLIGPIAGRLLAAMIAGGWVLVRVFAEFGMHFDYPLLRSSFSFNFYTFIYQLLQWTVNYVDRLVMVFFLVLSEIGVYDFALKCLLLIEFLSNGLHSAFYPKVVSAVMAQDKKGSSPEINRYYHGFTSVNLTMICVCILLIPVALDLVATRSGYEEAVLYIPYLALVYIFRTMRQFYSAPYGILKHAKPLPIIYAVVSVIKIGLIVLLIDRFRIYGVVAASLISAMVEIVLLYVNIRRKFLFRYNLFKIVVAPLAVFVMILVLEPTFGKAAPTLLHLSYVIVCAGLLWWAYRRELKLIDPFRIVQ